MMAKFTNNTGILQIDSLFSGKQKILLRTVLTVIFALVCDYAGNVDLNKCH